MREVDAGLGGVYVCLAPEAATKVSATTLGILEVTINKEVAVWAGRRLVSDLRFIKGEELSHEMGPIFRWDPEKARSNLRKHGVTFDEAASVFRDTLSFTISDPLHSTEESRFVTIGRSDRDRTLVVVHSDFGEAIRIISARLATRHERKEYEEASH